MQAIIGSSLKFRLVVLAIAAAMLPLGIVQLRDAPVDVLPEFTPPYVEIQTEASGLSADEVEQLITVPLEADLLNGVQGVDVIRSQSLPGLSSIVLVFEPGTDVYRGRQLVQERLTQLGGAALPMISKPSAVIPPLSSSSRVLMIGLSSDDLSPIQQSVIARWTIRPRLMGVPGVANVAIWGMRDQQIQVQVDPEHLRDRNVTLSQVVETAGNAQVFSPLSFLEGSTPGTGGFIETPGQRLQVRNVLETIADPNALAQVPVEDTGGRLSLGDVADIRIDHPPLMGDAVVNDGGGLLLVVEKYPGADTRAVTQGVEEALDRLEPGLAGIRTDTSIFRPASFVDEAIDNLTLAMLIGGVLLMLVLAAFFFQWRALLICLVTVPLALVAAGLVLHLLGEGFNAISLAGLAVAVAFVVDDAVIGVHSVSESLRRLRDQGLARSPSTVVREASHAMRSPLAYATLIGLVAIAPLAVMQGAPGGFFGPLVVSYAVAVAVAMVVALTVTPALCLLLLSGGTSVRGGSAQGRRVVMWWSARDGQSPVTSRIRPRFERALSAFVARPGIAIAAAVACVVVGLAALPFLHTALIPSFKDRHVIVRLDGPPGMSNPRMTEIATSVSRDLRSIPGVDAVAAHVGRATTGDQLVDVNSSEVWVTIGHDEDYDSTLASINDAVDRVEGVDHDVVTSLDQNIRAVGALDEGRNRVAGDGLDVLTGIDQPLVVRLYGQDIDVLNREAVKVREVMAGVEGVVDPRIDAQPTQRTVEIAVDLAKARAKAIKPGDVRRAEATLLQGILVGSVFQQQKVFDVIVQGAPELRTSESAVRNLLIDLPGGGHVRLGQVADVRIGETPTVINRDAVSRRVDVVATVNGRSLGSVASDLKERLATVSFPLEYHAEVLEKTTTAEIGARRMLAVAIAAAIAVFLLLQAAFQSFRLAALAFLSLPVALAGGVVAVLISGGELSLGAFLGLLAVFGIAARGSVVLIRHVQDLAEDDGDGFGAALIQRAASDRLVPVLATAAGLAAAAVPVVVLGGRPGLEILSPMAVVLLGGLLTSTFLTLFVLPATHLRFGGGAHRRGDAGDETKPRREVVVPSRTVPALARGGNGGAAGEPNGGGGADDPNSESGEHAPPS
ncbi:MAG: hypothetical protein QOF68_2646 [Gaiellales bacterium]|nr:hypothetical protein [Gaiellales bacterium]